MRLFDTHAHLTDRRFDDNRDTLIASLPTANIAQVVTCSVDINDCEQVATLCTQHNFVRAAYGVHPHEACNMTDSDLISLETFLKQPECVALGEVGLDYHYDFTPRALQQKRLVEQLELAISLDLPVILHDREAHLDMLRCLLPYKGKLRGVLHCYSGSAEMLKDYAPLDLYFGFTGVVTFSNAAKTRAAAIAVPQNRILIETDCPYLAPIPHRGKRNNPSFVAHVCTCIAELRGLDTEAFAEITYYNGRELFGL